MNVRDRHGVSDVDLDGFGLLEIHTDAAQLLRPHPLHQERLGVDPGLAIRTLGQARMRAVAERRFP
jgi:hypothetical protein